MDQFYPSSFFENVGQREQLSTHVCNAYPDVPIQYCKYASLRTIQKSLRRAKVSTLYWHRIIGHFVSCVTNHTVCPRPHEVKAGTQTQTSGERTPGQKLGHLIMI